MLGIEFFLSSRLNLLNLPGLSDRKSLFSLSQSSKWSPNVPLSMTVVLSQYCNAPGIPIKSIERLLKFMFFHNFLLFLLRSRFFEDQFSSSHFSSHSDSSLSKAVGHYGDLPSAPTRILIQSAVTW